MSSNEIRIVGAAGDGSGGGYEPGGTDVAVADGGTGASNASDARTNLGLAIGTDVQAQDAELQAIADLTSNADRLPYFTGSGTAALAIFTSAARTFITAADVGSQRAALSLGTIATQAAAAVALTGGTLAGVTISTSKWRSSLNTQTGTSYTLVITDEGKIVETNNAAANTVTIPPNASVAFPIGSRVDITQFGAGLTTIVAGAGVTIRSLNGLKSQGQYSAVTLYKRGTDEWVAIGALTT